jgi:hypothetical protein
MPQTIAVPPTFELLAKFWREPETELKPRVTVADALDAARTREARRRGTFIGGIAEQRVGWRIGKGDRTR